jgi:hypothetical protein
LSRAFERSPAAINGSNGAYWSGLTLGSSPAPAPEVCQYVRHKRGPFVRRSQQDQIREDFRHLGRDFRQTDLFALQTVRQHFVDVTMQAVGHAVSLCVQIGVTRFGLSGSLPRLAQRTDICQPCDAVG